MVELVMALLVGGLLMSIAATGFSSVSGPLNVRSAKTMYATLHQRARARSVELGETVLFYVDVAGDSAFILAPSQGVTDVTRFDDQMNVDLRSSGNFMLCMTPRGYADYDCGSFGGFITATSASAVRLEFWQNADSTSVTVLPMGQLVGM